MFKQRLKWMEKKGRMMASERKHWVSKWLSHIISHVPVKWKALEKPNTITHWTAANRSNSRLPGSILDRCQVIVDTTTTTEDKRIYCGFRGTSVTYPSTLSATCPLSELFFFFIYFSGIKPELQYLECKLWSTSLANRKQPLIIDN